MVRRDGGANNSITVEAHVAMGHKARGGPVAGYVFVARASSPRQRTVWRYSAQDRKGPAQLTFHTLGRTCYRHGHGDGWSRNGVFSTVGDTATVVECSSNFLLLRSLSTLKQGH
jgi:hypothetical protein